MTHTHGGTDAPECTTCTTTANASGEVRTTSSTGGQKGTKPQRHDLMPKEGLDVTAELFAYGAIKYADHNWRLGYPWSLSTASLMRHAQGHNNGETYDDCTLFCPHVEADFCPEHSRLPHLAAVAFHALVGLTWLETQGEGWGNPFDDRWPSVMERARRGAESASEEPLTEWEKELLYGAPSDEQAEAPVREVLGAVEIDHPHNVEVQAETGVHACTSCGYIGFEVPAFPCAGRETQTPARPVIAHNHGRMRFCTEACQGDADDTRFWIDNDHRFTDGPGIAAHAATPPPGGIRLTRGVL